MLNWLYIGYLNVELAILDFRKLIRLCTGLRNVELVMHVYWTFECRELAIYWTYKC